MEYSWFLAGLLMTVSSSDNMHPIIHILIRSLLRFYRSSITEPFSFLTMSARTAFRGISSSSACVLTDQTTSQDWLLYSGCLKYAHQTGLKWAGEVIYSDLSAGWFEKRASDLLFLLIRHGKWARMPSLCLNALARCFPLRELRHVNYICYQPRWWLIRYSCLLTMTSW